MRNTPCLPSTFTYAVPAEIDRAVAEIKLSSMSVSIDRLSPEQEEYLAKAE